MKELFLLRHAKSSRDDPALDDFDRPLARRGQKAAPRMGREIAARGWSAERVLVSPARRARQTWDLVAAELDVAPEAVVADVLYMGSPDRHMEALRETPESASRLMIVGHNPGLEALAAALSGPDSNEEARKRLREKFPTAALARLAFDGPWAGLAFGGAGLTHLLRPKDLA